MSESGEINARKGTPAFGAVSGAGLGDGRRARAFPKGRQVEPEALTQVRELLVDRPRRRDLLVEHLHLLNDRFGILTASHVVALAEEMGLPAVEVWEVASFYHNFEVTRDDSEATPEAVLRVCDSLPCALAGAEELYQELSQKLEGSGVRVLKAACMGRCGGAPVVRHGTTYLENTDAESARIAASQTAGNASLPAYADYAAYLDDGGYGLLRSCLEGKRAAKDILAALEDSGLRGLGGAGFPTARKWQLVAAESAPRLMAVNGDESEPGTFKDRHFLLKDPHRVLEGMLIGAWVTGAEEIYVYLRDEYADVRGILENELAKLAGAGLAKYEDAGSAGPLVHLRRGAGAYICGEESAMLESLEGRRGLPRHKPPFPAQVGLFGRPTLINNIETLYWVRDLVEKGPELFTGEGRNGRQGLRSFSVSGRVHDPGVKLAPAGITARELINEYCGGMAEGHTLAAYLPGGASGGILPASMADVPLDFGTLEEHGCLIGSAALIVLSDADDLKAAALNLMQFFENESCGQCTPCRSGTEKAAQLMAVDHWDQAILQELADCMAEASICGLGYAAANPLRSLIRYFPEAMS